MSPAEQRLDRAKNAASDLTTTDRGRKWLCTEIMVYGGERYLTRLHILQGTPPRAYIVENAERNICTVLDGKGQLLGEARYGDIEPVRWVPRAKRPR